MILYFDNYITDEPFYAGGHKFLGEVRDSKAKIYNMPSKLDITLYTLASYAEIEWSNVIIKYELENYSQRERFEKEVLNLFPKAILIYGRSDSQKKFQETIRFMNKLEDEWIFYAGNNDHPFLAPNKEILNACLNKAKKIAVKNKNVSIPVTSFTIFYNLARKGTPFHEVAYPSSRILEEDRKCIVALFPRGTYEAMQIVNKKLFTHWFFSGEAGSALIRRSEDIEPFLKRVKQISVIPKKELCAHFDGEFHTDKTAYVLHFDLCSPLFIPPGFFENKIKIRFGFEDYKEGWVNMNPLKEKYSFRDLENGTDLKIGLEDIPLFWKKRIKKIEINKDADTREIKKALEKRNYILKNPFPKKSRFFYVKYRLKSNFFAFLNKISFIRKSVKNLMENSEKFRKSYISLIKIKF
ncbi:MAG: hypothetical protein ABIE36_00435 [Candidatus Diapherotrites archaeon]